MTSQSNPSDEKGPRVEFLRQTHNLANNLLGKPLANAQPTLFDDWIARQPAQELVAETGCRVVGFDLDPPEQRAVEAVLKLIAKGGHQDRSLNLTLSDWLKSYGVERYVGADGKKKYSQKERVQAMEALINATKKTGAVFFSQQNEDGSYRVMEHRGALWQLTRDFDNVSEAEMESILRSEVDPNVLDKSGAIIIRPNDIFFVEKDTPYFYKPVNLWSEMQLAIGAGKKPAANTYNFLTWLYSQASFYRKRWEFQNTAALTLTVSFESLARQCRMTKELADGRAKRITDAITRNAEIAVKMGILSSYDLSDRANLTFAVNAETLFAKVEAQNEQQQLAFKASGQAALLPPPVDVATMLPSQLPKYIEDVQDKISTIKSRREFGYNAKTGQNRALLKDNTRREKQTLKTLNERLQQAQAALYGTATPKG